MKACVAMPSFLNLFFFLVEEAMRINKRLTSINEKQESTIKALKEVKERFALKLGEVLHHCITNCCPVLLHI